MTTDIARAIEQQCFAVSETTRGVLAFPTSAAALIKTAGYAEINQQPSFSESEEIDNTLDILDMFQDQASEGSFTIPIYVRPSGSLGSIPMADVLFESLQGEKTVTTDTNVVYSQAIDKPSFSLWVKKGHTVFYGRGACVSQASLNLSNKGGAKVEFTGGFMEMGWAGTDTVNGLVDASASVIVDNPKRFKAGARVQIGTDTNSGAGYEITAVDNDTSTLTLGTAVSCADGVTIKGFLPSFTVIGTPLESRNTIVKIDDVVTKITALKLDIGSPVEFQTDELTADNYPADYVEDKRSIKGTLDIKFRKDSVSDFADGLINNQKAIDISIGETAGSIMQILLGHSKMEVPSITTSAPTVKLSIPFTCLGSEGEDSCSIIFK